MTCVECGAEMGTASACARCGAPVPGYLLDKVRGRALGHDTLASPWPPNPAPGNSVGRARRVVRKAWLLLTVPFGLTTWAAFLYIGIRARRARWIAWAGAYASALTANLVLDAPVQATARAQNVAFVLVILTWIGGGVHAVAISNDALRRISSRNDPAVRVAEARIDARAKGADETPWHGPLAIHAPANLEPAKSSGSAVAWLNVLDALGGIPRVGVIWTNAIAVLIIVGAVGIQLSQGNPVADGYTPLWQCLALAIPSAIVPALTVVVWTRRLMSRVRERRALASDAPEPLPENSG
jgi:hypothetical protein